MSEYLGSLSKRRLMAAAMGATGMGLAGGVFSAVRVDAAQAFLPVDLAAVEAAFVAAEPWRPRAPCCPRRWWRWGQRR